MGATYFTHPFWQHVTEIIELLNEKDKNNKEICEYIAEKYNYTKTYSSNKSVLTRIKNGDIPNQESIDRNKKIITYNPIDNTKTVEQKEENVYSEKRNDDGSIQITDILERRLSDDDLFKRYNRDKNFWAIKMIWFKDVQNGVKLSISFAPKFVGSAGSITDIDFKSIFKPIVKPLKLAKANKNSISEFDRLVYTDVHVGMDVNKDGYSLYGGKWDEATMFNRLKELIEHTLYNKKSDVLYIDDLGDFMDGYNGQTVRGGHDLPQNMDNQKSFDLGLLFKIYLIDGLAPYYNKIIVHNVCCDNHAGSWGYVVNSAFKSYIGIKYPQRVTVNNLRRFINHYTVGNRVIILSHGKDEKNLKFGFKPTLDDKQINKITGYIDEYCVYSKSNIYEFNKGDSHQYIFDSSSSPKFSYHNFPAFSPPSNWVQTNFVNAISGFIHFNYYKNGQKSINPYIFK